MASTFPPPSEVFDVRTFGATPNDGRDDQPAFQAAFAAASKVRGGVVNVPAGDWSLASALDVRECKGVTVRGAGYATQIVPVGSYRGPLITVGMPAGDTTAACRPRLTPADYDGSVPGPRFAVATRGRQSLAITGHPLQHGPMPAGQVPTHWQVGGAFTFDFYFSGDPTCGVIDSHGEPAPFYALPLDGGLALLFTTDAGDGRHRIDVPGATGGRVSLQFDLDAGKVAAWVEGKAVAATFNPQWPWGVGSRFPCKLAAGGGVMPFCLGGAPDGGGGSIVAATWKGFRVVKGEVYQWGNPVQTVAGTGLAANDWTRFFEQAAPVVPPGSLIACLPLSDPPGKSTVRVNGLDGDSVLHWLPRVTGTNTDTARVKITGVNCLGSGVTLLIGRHLGLTLVDSSFAGGAQGVGSMPLAYSWPLRIDGCAFAGYDAAVCLKDQTVNVRATDLEIGPSGQALRLTGTGGVWENVLVYPPRAGAKVAVSFVGNDDGSNLTLRGVSVDNEEGTNYSRAIVEAEQGFRMPSRISVDGLGVAAAAPGVPVFRLVGHGDDPRYLSMSRVTVTNTTVFTAADVLSVTGPGWYGRVEGAAGVLPAEAEGPAVRP